MATELTTEYDGHRFADDAPDRAAFVQTADGGEWHVPIADGGHYVTTDEGLRNIRLAIGESQMAYDDDDVSPMDDLD